MKRNMTLKAMVTALTLGIAVAAQAEDIDLFRVNANDYSDGNAPSPNVLFVLDNSANWDATLPDGSHKSDILHDALFDIVTNTRFVMDPAVIRAGIMTLSKSNSPKGGVVTAAIKDLDFTWSETLAGRIKYGGVETGQDILPKTNNRPFALTFNEAYRYFKGLTPNSGLANGIYSNVATRLNPSVLLVNEFGYDPDALVLPAYKSPLVDGDTCARNIIIFIANGHPDAGEDGDAETKLTALGGKLPSDPLPLNPSNDQSNWADEYARYLAGIDLSDTQGGMQNITTYVIDVYNPSTELRTNVDRAARAYLQSIATQGKGQYFTASNTEQLRDALLEILNTVIAHNGAFASSTLPVSVNVRGTNLNQVYMGVFRPDADWRPRWMGNLKLYKLALDSNDNLYLADANDNPAEDRVNGFILDSAVSHWTQDDSINYWNFAPYIDTDPSESPDGKTVEKGAAAQALRNDVIAGRLAGDAYTDTRYLYTCSDAACGTIIKFDTNTATTVTQLGTTTPTPADLVDWIYGKPKPAGTDDDTTEGDRTGNSAHVRASVHGDVLHSRPAVISYSDTDTDIMAYYGANDGIFRALKGGTALTEGHERWGFIPYELLPKLRQLYLSHDPTSPLDIDADGKPYFMDGSIGVWREPAYGTPTRVNLFVSMRRGGRSLYALNVSSMPPASQSAAPFSVLWTKNNTSGGRYSELGYTFSEPKVAKIRTTDTTTYPGGLRTVIFFGGGYDPAYDDTEESTAVPGTYLTRQSAATMGRDIFAVDAQTGAIVWTAASYMSTDPADPNNFVQQYPVPSDVSLIDFDRDGVVDRLYVGDTGGNLWRVTIDDEPDVSQWGVKKLASVGSTHKFLYAPDVVKIRDGQYAVLFGSGDRENPKNYGVSITTHHDYFFMFLDKGVNDLTMSNLTNVTDTSVTTVDLATSYGWYIQLRDGEKAISGAVTLNGVTYFNTSQMGANGNVDPATCAPTLGTARVYAVNYKNAVAAFTTGRDMELAGGGLPPSPVAAMTELTNSAGNDELVEAVIIGPTPIKATGPKVGKRTKNYWFKDFE